MKFANAYYIDHSQSDISVELDGVRTAVPVDTDNAIFRALTAAGISIAAGRPVTRVDVDMAVQTHIDAVAMARGYSDGRALAGYATSTVPAWRQEAMAFVAWRDRVWLETHELMAAAEAGRQPLPGIADLISSVVAIDWTASHAANTRT